MTIKHDLEKYYLDSIKWLNLQLSQFYSDISPKLIESARGILIENKKVASGLHMTGIQTNVEMIAELKSNLYLFSPVKSPKGFPYDTVILAGSKYTTKAPPPSSLYVWIEQKARRGAFQGVNGDKQKMRSLAFAISKSILKRGTHKTLPFDYVGLTISKEKSYIINRFMEIDKR